MSDALYTMCEQVSDATSLAHFIAALGVDRRLADELATTPDGFQGQWANQTIAGFLEASAAWAKDSRLTHEKATEPTSPWRAFARILWAGRGYE
jgi:hypothetical protein